MEPVFDRNGRVSAWEQDGELYSPSGATSAFLQGESVVNYAGVHCGVFKAKFFRDLNGKVVAFMRGAEGGPRLPFTPLAALPPHPAPHPMRPPVPMAPVHAIAVPAWSDLSWEQFTAALRPAASHQAHKPVSTDQEFTMQQKAPAAAPASQPPPAAPAPAGFAPPPPPPGAPKPPPPKLP